MVHRHRNGDAAAVGNSVELVRGDETSLHLFIGQAVLKLKRPEVEACLVGVAIEELAVGRLNDVGLVVFGTVCQGGGYNVARFASVKSAAPAGAARCVHGAKKQVLIYLSDIALVGCAVVAVDRHDSRRSCTQRRAGWTAE